ncbi:hypothetical protein EV186_103921 [Labedaea rhizosphaerae]|uniref:Uncharacterized protein n=1 Tax=Labedaea rhizosphaerae TaxID=598644 RepID=A0A4R6SDD8_LABRH|nr:hypothetical protein EV186_103921 [Labedaea rhizosphaerae]
MPEAALRGTSFGDRWIEVRTSAQDARALREVIADRGRTGPRSLRLDDVVVNLGHAEVEVRIGETRVGSLWEVDMSRYAPVLRTAGRPVESSGIIIIDADGHPGSHVKLYLPDPDMLVPANSLDPTVLFLPAHDRAGGITLARRKADHELIEAATASLWSGRDCSVWVLLTRTSSGIDASIDKMPLPSLSDERAAALLLSWEAQYPRSNDLQFESILYSIRAGRQVCVRFSLA